jgi:hypothetical protein
MSEVIFIPGGYNNPIGPGDITPSFEIISKNLKSYPYAITYSGKDIDYITYDLGGGAAVVKTFGYSGKDLITVTLSGDIPSGIDTIKTLGYTGKDLTSVAYS